jgi:DNA primase
MIPKSFVQDLLSRVDIVDVIESCFPLKRAGSNLAACCPFHNEKSPSFTVSPAKQFYHCFGCGAHGSAIGFLMEYSGMSFVEAVKDLAERVGLQVPDERPHRTEAPSGAGSQGGTDALLDVLHRAAAFYKAELKKSERAIAYLKGRGLTGEVAGRFALGYAPAGWQGLAAVFPQYADRLLVEAGLVIQGEEGKRYDRFRDRIMFPIVSQRGQVIGFGGRVLDKSEPKYLNSPETPVFEKGHELYGLFQARQGIRAEGRVIVVEGYMDVVALAQFGVANAVATLGTATTPQHVQKLLRQTDEVVFCFDGDAAGRRAAWRALENALEHLQDGKQVKFLFLPPEHDPDSYLRVEGRAAFDRLLLHAVPLSAFAVKELASHVDMGTAEGRAKFLQDSKPLVQRIHAPILRAMLRDQLAQLTGLGKDEVAAQLGLKPPAAPVARAAAAAPRLRPSLIRNLTRLLALRPQLAQLADAGLLDAPAVLGATVGSQEERDFLGHLLRAMVQGTAPVSLSEEFRDTPFAKLAAELERDVAEVSSGGEEALRQEFLDGWHKMVEAVQEAERRMLEPRVIAGQATPEERERYRSLQGKSAARLAS